MVKNEVVGLESPAHGSLIVVCSIAIICIKDQTSPSSGWLGARVRMIGRESV